MVEKKGIDEAINKLIDACKYVRSILFKLLDHGLIPLNDKSYVKLVDTPGFIIYAYEHGYKLTDEVFELAVANTNSYRQHNVIEFMYSIKV